METVSPRIIAVVFDSLRSFSTSDLSGLCVVNSSLSSTTFGLVAAAVWVGVLGIIPLITDRSFSDTAGEVTVGMYH